MSKKTLSIIIIIQFLFITGGYFFTYFKTNNLSGYQLKLNDGLGETSISNQELIVDTKEGSYIHIAPSYISSFSNDSILREEHNRFHVEPYDKISISSSDITIEKVGYDTLGIEYKIINRITSYGSECNVYIDTSKKFKGHIWDSQGRLDNFKIPSNASIDYVSKIN